MPETCLEDFYRLLPIAALLTKDDDIAYKFLFELENAFGNLPQGPLSEACYTAAEIMRLAFSSKENSLQLINEKAAPYMKVARDSVLRLNGIIFETQDPHTLLLYLDERRGDEFYYSNQRFYLLSQQIKRE